MRQRWLLQALPVVGALAVHAVSQASAFMVDGPGTAESFFRGEPTAANINMIVAVKEAGLEEEVRETFFSLGEQRPAWETSVSSSSGSSIDSRDPSATEPPRRVAEYDHSAFTLPTEDPALVRQQLPAGSPGDVDEELIGPEPTPPSPRCSLPMTERATTSPTPASTSPRAIRMENGAAEQLEPSDYRIHIQANGDGIDAFFRAFLELVRSAPAPATNQPPRPLLRGAQAPLVGA
ncbi:hypothetical protein P43SY_005422 [Pythium insidiosum]|uniref:Uncharacterized protein n=1 Tax=Pythium insidiosum TaxID=114742 RepID=A0AAD5LTC5_PYTIN|nr:hypothetical protein P43SY_005422 [Pythium insidiosum]